MGSPSGRIEDSFELLDELIIQADRDRNIKEAITGVTQIQVQEIKNIPLVLGERDILKVATSLPGITKAGEGSAGYNVRGGKEDQNLILLDNGVLYNPSHFFGIFSIALQSISIPKLFVETNFNALPNSFLNLAE